MGKLLFLLLLLGCATQPQYKEGKVLRVETSEFLTDDYDGIPDREPDIKSIPANPDAYPDTYVLTWYRVAVKTKVRDFPSYREGNVIGVLDQGHLLVGFEIEGKWMHIDGTKESYVFLPHLQKIQSIQQDTKKSP